MNSSALLEQLNHTELYQLCRAAGLHVSPAASREELMAYLIGDAEPPPMNETTHPIDSWRHGIINFLLDHWAVVEGQLKCPARQLMTDKRPCFQCLDTQAIACVVQNPGRKEHLIRSHRPKQGTED